MKRSAPVLVIFILPLALGMGCGKAPVAVPPQFVEYSHPQGLFSCEFPKGWPLVSSPRDKTPQAVFRAPLPQGDVPAAPSLWAYFYKDGEAFKDADSYAAAKTLSRKGRESGPVSETSVAGRRARAFSLERRMVRSPEDPVEDVRVREEYLVLEADGGFYVLGGTFPLMGRDLAARRRLWQAQLDRFTRTFKPSR